MDADKLVEEIEALHPVVHECITQQRAAAHKVAHQGKLPSFEIDDYMLVAPEDFHAGERLVVRCLGPRQHNKTVSGYVYTEEHLRMGTLEEVHISRLNFYKHSHLDSNAVLTHVLTLETGMVVYPLLGLNGRPDGLWKNVICVLLLIG